jgi:DNA-binding response OmpR family regulator
LNQHLGNSADQTLNLLIVDDDAGIRDLLADYLTKQGMRVVTARDGKEMDEQLAIQYPDLIVMDLMMPGEDGLSLTRRVKAARDVPVIMLSARGEDIDRIVGLEVGADDYLPKPFNPRELLARIRAVLRRGHAGNSTRMPARWCASARSDSIWRRRRCRVTASRFRCRKPNSPCSSCLSNGRIAPCRGIRSWTA